MKYRYTNHHLALVLTSTFFKTNFAQLANVEPKSLFFGSDDDDGGGGLGIDIPDFFSDINDGVCKNKASYIYQSEEKKNDSWSCQDIQFDETLRIELCQEGEVRGNCPLACGVCCDDDPYFKFTKLNELEASCYWISQSDERKERYCDDLSAGEDVRIACPKTCGTCPQSVSVQPSDQPTDIPSVLPTSGPTSMPTAFPSIQPSGEPSASPSSVPSTSFAPTLTSMPSDEPSTEPSLNPTISPSNLPSALPSVSQNPSSSPSNSQMPSSSPTGEPSTSPTAVPTAMPTHTPSEIPTSDPSGSPTSSPSDSPSDSPTQGPSSSPTAQPTNTPTDFPSASPQSSPSASPSSGPSRSPTPEPTDYPTKTPTLSPSGGPSASPTKTPTKSPTESPSKSPTSSPSDPPTKSPTDSPTEKRPNLVMILTDEHNFRTLNCYRKQLLSKYMYHSSSTVDVWGNVFLETPNIDRLASEGALYTNYYTVAPLCTPSRASFFTGLYPQFTGGADMNHGAMSPDLKTWAEVLRDEKGYHTGYMGKWHLDGEEKPLWGSNGRDFGFIDNKYRYNRGHWKYFAEDANGKVDGYEIADEWRFVGNYNEHFSTDFLMNRGIDFIESAVDKNEAFALVLSIPDPHGPNDNRPFYRNLYDDVHFKVPESARNNWKFDPAPPGFNSFLQGEGPPIDDVDAWIEEFEHGPFFQNHMQQYYGMVKCIDYNVGKLLRTLEDKGILDDTIIVFTSDHGDNLMEHGKLNKGRPYETSAGIPFIVRYPEEVPRGKVIETAYSSIDFAPTILNLMNAGDSSFTGIDGSEELTNSQMVTSDKNQIVFSFDTGNKPIWAAAIKDSYKLVVSKNDFPWLFDLNIDPEEMRNYADSLYHQDIMSELRTAMIKALQDYKVPLTGVTSTIYLDMPKCHDSKSILPMGNGKVAFCRDIGDSINFMKCINQAKIANHCPLSCGACLCEDSPGLLWVNDSARSCRSLGDVCHMDKVRSFCPLTCGTCTSS